MTELGQIIIVKRTVLFDWKVYCVNTDLDLHSKTAIPAVSKPGASNTVLICNNHGINTVKIPLFQNCYNQTVTVQAPTCAWLALALPAFLISVAGWALRPVRDPRWPEAEDGVGSDCGVSWNIIAADCVTLIPCILVPRRPEAVDGVWPARGVSWYIIAADYTLN